jgi:lysophospholipase L1-like esterase
MEKIISTLIMAAIAVGVYAADKTLGEFEFNEKQKKNMYYKNFVQWAKSDAKRVPDINTVLCVGSSSMRMWRYIKNDLAPLKVIHRGFGGSTMARVLIWENFFLRYNAGTVLIYEGDNDLVGFSSKPESFIANCKKFCSALLKQNPKVKIYFISIKPSVRRVNAWGRMTKGNELLIKYAASNPQIHFIDASTDMLDKEGKPRADILVKDNLHMNRKGYAIWTKHVRKALIN